MMRVLVAHNFYQQPGGEDAVFRAEVELLRGRGHAVIEYTTHNDQIQGITRLRAGVDTVWSRSSAQTFSTLLAEHQPDVVHFHNFFPLISPAAHVACKKHGVPAVQTLHNYRLLCPNALCYREEKVCEDCLGRKIAWPGVVHACYRGSRVASATVAAMSSIHRVLGTWETSVDSYIALTEFARRKFVQGGLPEDKIAVKPHFVDPDPGPGRHEGDFALFVGRLSTEKGVEMLLETWQGFDGQAPLKIVGDGPLADRVLDASQRMRGVEWLGHKSAADVLDLMGQAKVVIVPSTWYETFGRVVMEAFARGTPVISSSIGALAELVDDGQTGLLFEPGDTAGLAARMRRLWSQPDLLAGMRINARRVFEERYTAAANYESLMHIYQAAISRRVARPA